MEVVCPVLKSDQRERLSAVIVRPVALLEIIFGLTSKIVDDEQFVESLHPHSCLAMLYLPAQ